MLFFDEHQDSPSKGRDHGIVIVFSNVSEDILNHIPVDEARLKELAISNTL